MSKLLKFFGIACIISLGTASESNDVLEGATKEVARACPSRIMQEPQKPTLVAIRRGGDKTYKQKFSADYITYCQSWGDIVMFGYTDNTSLDVDSLPEGTTVWQDVWDGTVNNNNYHHLTVPGGDYQYRAIGSEKYGLLAGDPIGYVVYGYYAVDENGKGLSTKLLTYMPNNSYGPEKFVIFAYEDGISGQVYVPATGYTGNFDLNTGEHYVETDNCFDKFIIVTANKPVAAFSYGDQGTFVPTQDGSFVGYIFYTYLGAVGSEQGWRPHDLNIISYENGASVTVKNSETDATLWSGTINKGESHTYPGNDIWIKVESTGKIAVSIQPFASGSSNYYYLTRNIDESGDGIGTHFYALTLENGINNAYITGFPYLDNTTVTVTGVGSVTLDVAGNGFKLSNPANKLYEITADKPISCYSWYGGAAGADFTPLWWTDPQGIEEAAIPEKFNVTVTPNPLTRFTVIRVITEGTASVEIFDVVGRKIETLFTGATSGELKLSWDASKRKAGIYFLRVKAGNYSENKKLILL